MTEIGHFRLTRNGYFRLLLTLDCDDEFVKKFAQFLYDKDYAPYTAKQWGISPMEVDRDIFKRVPILFSYGSRYFDDTYQAMPKKGYTEFIEKLLDHKKIKVEVGEDALNHISISEQQVRIDGKQTDSTVIYTGPIDELFECRYGELPYRSLRFEWVHSDVDSFQDMAVVAYPQESGFTRITEYKKLPVQEIDGTTYAVEYPLPYKKGEKNEPYYPVLTEDSKSLYERYRNLADAILGNRKRRGDGFGRKMVENVLRLYIRVFLGVWVPDANAPYHQLIWMGFAGYETTPMKIVLLFRIVQ